MKNLLQYNAWVDTNCVQQGENRVHKVVGNMLARGHREPTRFRRQQVQPLDYSAIAERSQRVLDASGSDGAVRGLNDFNADPYLVYGSRDTSMGDVTPPGTPQQRVRNGRHVQAHQEARDLGPSNTDWSEEAQAFKRPLPEGKKRGDRAQMAKDRHESNRATALTEKRKEQVAVNTRLDQKKRKADNSLVGANREAQRQKQYATAKDVPRASKSLQTQERVKKPEHRDREKFPPHSPGPKPVLDVHMKPSGNKKK